MKTLAIITALAVSGAAQAEVGSQPLGPQYKITEHCSRLAEMKVREWEMLPEQALFAGAAKLYVEGQQRRKGIYERCMGYNGYAGVKYDNIKFSVVLGELASR